MWLTCPGCSARLEVPVLDVPLEQAVISCDCGVAGRLRFEQVRSRMDSAVAKLTARLRQDLESNRLKLPALPDVVLKVERMARDENAGAPEIAAVVERDPVLATKLLKLANSVLYRGRVEARTVQQAIARLGMANLRDYVLAILSRELYVVADPALGRFIERLWEHAITVAVASRELATRMRTG
ncbi:MAG: HDOD domain-containing protein, partial [Planctomycetota bacterium]